jgi:ribosomal protein S18 acetylase RimI-like enzyme
MFEVQILKEEKTAKRIGEFLTSENAFEQTWAPNEKAMVMKAPLDSLENENHRYWYVEKDDKVIGAIGVRENKYGSGGYEMDADYVAVHKDFRRNGIASKLLSAMEHFVKEKNGRYIHVLTCDIDSYKPALSFYENNGYTKVAKMPNYYVENEGRIDYFKEL